MSGKRYGIFDYVSNLFGADIDEVKDVEKTKIINFFNLLKIFIKLLLIIIIILLIYKNIKLIIK